MNPLNDSYTYKFHYLKLGGTNLIYAKVISNSEIVEEVKYGKIILFNILLKLESNIAKVITIK